VADKGVEETDGSVCGNGVVEPLWAQDGCVAVGAVEKTHKSTTLQENTEVSRCRSQCDSLPKHGVFTQSGAAPDCCHRPLRSRFRQQVSAGVRHQRVEKKKTEAV
jgi:hypothetical protein